MGLGRGTYRKEAGVVLFTMALLTPTAQLPAANVRVHSVQAAVSVSTPNWQRHIESTAKACVKAAT